MKKLLIALLIGIGIYGYILNSPEEVSKFTKEGIQKDEAISNAYHNQLSDIQITGSGKVSRILDDDKGSRHQRFILLLSSDQTLLVAHNIDLGAKISTLKKDDVVQFFGEYEWNSKGGIVHWTHHDPSGQHVGGWLKHNGQKYE